MGARITIKGLMPVTDGNAISESETGTNVAKNLDDQAQTPKHVRGRGGLTVFNNI